MTSRRTAAPCFSFLEIYRQIPCSERHSVSYVFWIVACVCFMTCTACPAFFRFIHMLKMEVYLAVSKICEFSGLRVLHNYLVMTAEAESIVFWTIRHVEYSRICLSQ